MHVGRRRPPVSSNPSQCVHLARRTQGRSKQQRSLPAARFVLVQRRAVVPFEISQFAAGGLPLRRARWCIHRACPFLAHGLHIGFTSSHFNVCDTFCCRIASNETLFGPPKDPSPSARRAKSATSRLPYARTVVGGAQTRHLRVMIPSAGVLSCARIDSMSALSQSRGGPSLWNHHVKSPQVPIIPTLETSRQAACRRLEMLCLLLSESRMWRT